MLYVCDEFALFDRFASCNWIRRLTGRFRCMKCTTREFLCAVIVIVDCLVLVQLLRVIVLISILSPFTVAVLVLKKTQVSCCSVLHGG